MKAPYVVWLGIKLREEPLRIWTRCKNSAGNEIWSIYEYFEMWTFYTSDYNRNNGDNKTSSKQQWTPETTTDTQDVSTWVLIILQV